MRKRQLARTWYQVECYTYVYNANNCNCEMYDKQNKLKIKVGKKFVCHETQTAYAATMTFNKCFLFVYFSDLVLLTANLRVQSFLK